MQFLSLGSPHNGPDHQKESVGEEYLTMGEKWTAGSYDGRCLLTEKIHFLPDVPANAHIPLAFEPLFEYIQYRLFSDNEPLPVDPSHLLQVHYKW